MIEVQEATRTYHQGQRTVHALRGVSLRVEPGEFVSIMGPSGSGKSTLLQLIGALATPTSGRVLLNGQDVQALSDRQRSRLRLRHIGFIFQFFNLVPSLTALENIALPLMLMNMPRRHARSKALEALARVGLDERAEHFPEELSGGEMQRIAIARALILEPGIILCDEPTGNLDSANSKDILAMLRQLPDNGRRAVVLVTHDEQAAQVGDRIVRLRDGRIERESSVRGRHALAV